MTDLIIIAVLAVIVGLAAGYVYKAKKSGKKCIGCPESGACKASQKSGSCCCGSTELK